MHMAHAACISTQTEKSRKWRPEHRENWFRLSHNAFVRLFDEHSCFLLLYEKTNEWLHQKVLLGQKIIVKNILEYLSAPNMLSVHVISFQTAQKQEKSV